MKRAPDIASRPVLTADFLDVHRRTHSIDNRGVPGRSSIVSRSAAMTRASGSGSGARFAIIFATILGALTLAHLVRALSTRRGAGNRQYSRLNALRSAIVGVQKKQIAAVLGPPRATIGRGNYLTDDTWYYPIDPNRRRALAIEFDRGVARQAQVINGIRSASHGRA